MYAMRNRIAHGYFKVDFELVWKTIHEDLPELHALIGQLFTQLLNDSIVPKHFLQTEAYHPDKSAIPDQTLTASRSIKGRNSARIAFSVTRSTGQPNWSSNKN